MTLALAKTESSVELAGPISCKVTVDAKTMHQTLQMLSLVARNHRFSPFLKNVRLVVNGSSLTMQATDGETNASADVQAEVVGLVAPYSFCVPPDALRGALPKKGMVEVGIAEQAIQVGVHRIKTESDSDFPAITIPLAAVVTNLFPDDLHRVAYAMSKDETRFNLRGCLMESVKGKLRLVATDGHRLALLNTDRVYSGAKLIVPRQIIDIILKLKPIGVLVSTTKEKLVFALLGFGTLVVSPIEGEYPDYPVVIPRKQTGHLFLKREAWLRAINDLLPVAKGTKSPIVKNQLVEGNGLALSSENEAQAASCVVAIEPGPNTDVLAAGWGLNLLYVKDILSALTSETVRLGFNDPQSQFTVTGDSPRDVAAIHVVMPTRV